MRSRRFFFTEVSLLRGQERQFLSGKFIIFLNSDKKNNFSSHCFIRENNIAGSLAF